MNTTSPINKNSRFSATTGFRTDINLLRGIAILSVVFYHFTAIPHGGFVGVDVFFVISGFLMCQIIISAVEKRSFSLLLFYAARCKRIIPALLAICTVLVAITYFWLPNFEYRKLGNYLRYVVLFISNIKLNKEASGYFATDSHENWFLHTWSLAVEWQFYLIFPLILIALYRFKDKFNIGLALSVITLCSFIACMIYSYILHSTSAFYLMPFRAWEMLCGSLVWCAAQRYPINILWRQTGAIIGYAIVIISIFFINTEAVWPGLLTLLPVAGTMLVIYSDDPALPHIVEKNFRWIGLSSYSVYLWHWPAVVFLIYADQPRNILWVASGIVLSFLVGWLSWIIIEKPIKRFLGRLPTPRFWGVIFVCITCFWLFGYLVKYQLILNYPDPLVNKVAEEENNFNNAPDPKTKMSYYGQGKPVAIIIGDSHAEATATALAEAAKDRGSVIGITYQDCPNLADGSKVDENGNSMENNECYEFNQSLKTRLTAWSSDIPVIIVNRTTMYVTDRLISFGQKAQSEKAYRQQFADALVSMACSLNQTHPLFLVRPIPEMDVNVPRSLSHALLRWEKPEDISISLEAYHNRHDFIWQTQNRAATECGVTILDPLPYLCEEGRCYGSKDLQPRYYDDDHLSETGNKLLIPMFQQIFSSPPSKKP